jgi:hypothetical protein
MVAMISWPAAPHARASWMRASRGSARVGMRRRIARRILWQDECSVWRRRRGDGMSSSYLAKTTCL